MLCSRRTPSFLRSSSSGLHSRCRSCQWPVPCGNVLSHDKTCGYQSSGHLQKNKESATAVKPTGERVDHRSRHHVISTKIAISWSSPNNVAVKPQVSSYCLP
uniref:Uncharacterized protein n=1 Tax=Oryza glaberrima TaxID=4538 RepID=I1NXB6_ORYGL